MQKGGMQGMVVGLDLNSKMATYMYTKNMAEGQVVGTCEKHATTNIVRAVGVQEHGPNRNPRVGHAPPRQGPQRESLRGG